MSKKNEVAEKKPGFFARSKRSVKSSLTELKKVHWLTKEENLRYTGVVVGTVTVVSVILWVIDSGIAALLKLFV